MLVGAPGKAAIKLLLREVGAVNFARRIVIKTMKQLRRGRATMELQRMFELNLEESWSEFLPAMMYLVKSISLNDLRPIYWKHPSEILVHWKPDRLR